MYVQHCICVALISFYLHLQTSTSIFLSLDFEPIISQVKALRLNQQFVDEVTSGMQCGIILDKTCCYAEQGGQAYDLGFMVKVGDEVTTSV